MAADMRGATCASTKTSKVPTEVRSLFNTSSVSLSCGRIFKKFAINARISSVKTLLSLDLYFVLQRTMTLPWHGSGFTQRKRKKYHHSNEHLKLYQNVFLAFLYSAMQPMYGRLDYMKCDSLSINIHCKQLYFIENISAFSTV